MATVWYDALINVLGYSLTVNYVGNGLVTALPDQAAYAYGTVVSLTAEAASGWTFSSWSGDLVSSVNPASVTMGSNKTITATFTQNQYTLTVTTNSGTTTPSAGDHLYLSGSTVSISASSPTTGADTRYTWLGWSGTGIGSYTGTNNPVSITMNGPVAEAALWKVECKLTISTNLGTTTPTAGDYWYQAGTSVNVQSSPPPSENGVQYVSPSWSGTGSAPASGSTSSVTFTINTPSNITWIWRTQYYLTVSSSYGTVGGAGWYDAGSSAHATITPTTITGVAGTQYTFTGWSGDASGKLFIFKRYHYGWSQNGNS